MLTSPFKEVAELRAIADGKPTTHAELSRLLLGVIAELSVRFECLDEELEDVLEAEEEAGR